MLAISLRQKKIETMTIDRNSINIKKLISDFKKEHAELGKIINPIIEKYNLQKKEFIEVCQIGKFIYKINSEMRIIEKSEPPNPDFIIEHASKIIGLEHTRIFTENANNYNKIVTLLDYAQEIYRSEFPNEKLHAIISIQDDKIKYSQKEKRKFATEIANYIYNFNKGIEIERPPYISNIRTTIHSKISFSYKEINWDAPLFNKRTIRN